jgi:dihydrofolate reductase
MAVIATASISLDGFVARPDDNPGPIFDWFEAGDVAIAPGDPDRVFHIDQASADYTVASWRRTVVGIVGRRLFDITNGWDGRPPGGLDGHVIVVTHEPPTDWPFADSAPFSFVDGIEEAVRQAVERAGDLDVSITGGDLTGQALRAGLVDELRLGLTPVILGTGKSFFGDYAGDPILFDDPEVVQGERVLHLHYRKRA